jgi:hypothetical protein
MTLIKTGILALALTASLGALVTSASAATRAERQAAREARAQAQEYRAQRYLPSANGYSSFGYANGATDRAAPNECRVDNGYGRYDTCDH